MSGVATGNARVDSIIAKLSKLGYRCAPVKASGRRGQRRQDLKLLGGDIIAFAPSDSLLSHALVEVGGGSKRARSILEEMAREGLPAGFRPLLARCKGRRWLYFRPGLRQGLESLETALGPE